MFQQLPEQIIPENQKDTAWVARSLKAIKHIATSSLGSRAQDAQCYNMYFNGENADKYDYLRKVSSSREEDSDYELPAFVRHIPIQKNKIDTLISHQVMRPWINSVRIVDEKSKRNKFHDKVISVIKDMDNRIMQEQVQRNSQISQLQQQLQQIDQMTQQEPQDEQQAAQIQEMLKIREYLGQQMGVIQQMEERNKIMDDENFEKMKKYYYYSYKDAKEHAAQKVLNKLKVKQDLKRKDKQGFQNKCITGKELYYVDYIPGQKHPIFEVLNPMKVYYPGDEATEYVQHCDWVMIEDALSKSQIADIYQLKKEELDSIVKGNHLSAPTTGEFVATSEGALHIANSNKFYTGSNQGSSFSRYRIFWKSQTPLYYMYTPSRYRKGEFVSKVMTEEPDPKKMNKEGHIEKRYITNIYYGHMINDRIVKSGKKEVVFRSEDDWNQVWLPVVAKTFNQLTEQPYSLVWATKDIQSLYNIINFHKELYLAVSGVKGTVMDWSQKPRDMSMSEWMYQKKLGTKWIETMHKSGASASFNQFPNFDDTVSPAIQYLDGMLQNLEATMDSMLGTPPQRRGELRPNDQSTTFTKSIQQANLVTMVLYMEHDDVFNKALTLLLNISLKYAYKDGFFDEITMSDGKTEYINIPKGMFNNIDTEVYCLSDINEEFSMKELRDVAIQYANANALPVPQLIDLFRTNNMTEMYNKFEMYYEEAAKLQQQNAQAEREGLLAVEDRKAQLKGQMDKELENMKTQFKQMELEWKDKVEGAKLQNSTKELAIKEQDLALKYLDIVSEREVETAYLEEQERSSRVNEQLNALRLQVDSIISNMGLQIQADSNEKQHKQQTKKLAIEDKKENNRKKEYIKN